MSDVFSRRQTPSYAIIHQHTPPSYSEAQLEDDDECPYGPSMGTWGTVRQ